MTQSHGDDGAQTWWEGRDTIQAAVDNGNVLRLFYQ